MKKFTGPSPRIVVAGMGHDHPDTILDNQFFSTLDIDSSEEWILERTGIKERRSVLTQDQIRKIRFGEETLLSLRKKNEVPSIGAMCVKPWQRALKRASFVGDMLNVDALICGTSVPDFDIPANACRIASELKLECTAFDVNSACSSFVVDLHVAKSMLWAKQAKTVAVFNPERYTMRVNYQDRGSCILWGDGCVGTIVESDPHRPGLEVIDTVVVSNPSKYDSVVIPDGEYFFQDGKAVQRFAITKTIAIVEEILSRNEIQVKDVNYFIGHQANLRMLQSAMEHLHVAPERHLYDIENFGNRGAAGAPSVLSTYWEKFQSGDLIILAVVGSGLTWGAALLKRS